MFTKINGLILMLTMMLTLNGCGDLLGSNVVKRSLDASSISSVNCELDVNNFSDIMKRDISSDIKCLHQNLNFFIKIVTTEKPGYLSRVQLENYLSRFRPDVKPEVVKALKSIFGLGHLITGEHPDFISQGTIDKVMKFAEEFNSQASLNFAPTFQNESQSTYANHQRQRDRLSTANKAIIQALRPILNRDRNGEIHKLNIIELLDSFSTEDSRVHIEKAKKVLFLKKVLLGGEADVITHLELESLIMNFDHLLLIALDAVRYKYIELNQDSLLQLLKRDVKDLYDITHLGALNNRDGETLFTMNQAIEAAKVFTSDSDFDLEKYRNLILQLKTIAVEGDTVSFKGSEFRTLFTHAQSILQTGTVFHRIYDKFRSQLESPLPVSINFDEYRQTYPEYQAEVAQFERIVKKYRFFKGEAYSAYFTRANKRNADGVFEVAMYEYLLKLFFKAFGFESPGGDTVGGYSLDQKRMQKLLKTFEKELVEMDILLPNRAEGTADTITLLGSLFQYQSDKKGFFDINEATEFVISLLTALNVQDDVFKYMEKAACPKDAFNRIEPTCFRKTFWKALCNDYRSYYPLLFESLGLAASKTCDEFQETDYTRALLDREIEAARTCNFYTDGNKEEIHYAKGDIMTTMIAIIHTETTILRWDTNNNNVMDASEVDKAYEIYGPALDGFLEGKSPLIKKFKKQIFQYMIKYEEIPDEKEFGSIMKFVRFLLSFNKKASADRKTIASLLVAIGEQNTQLQTAPQFNCNYLRDPDNIPAKRAFTSSQSTQVDNRTDYSYELIPYEEHATDK